jgi:predicted permease
MPREFNGIAADTAPDVRIPGRAFPLISLNPNARPGFTSLELAGRLKPGITLAQAQQECVAIWQAVTRESYRDQPGDLARELKRGMMLQPLEFGVSVLRDRFALPLKVLAGCVALLLMMACSNVAGLLLARGAARREEIAVRLAIGATRARLVRQMLTESLLLALAGAAAGWLLAWIATPLFLHSLPPLRDLGTTPLQLSLNTAPDWRLILFSAAVAILTAILCGIAPAIGAARSNLDGILRGARSRGGWRGRRALVILQVALCTLLLAGAGLLIRTFERLRHLDPGFEPDRVVTFTLEPALSGYSDAQASAFWRALIERVRSLPGVEGMAAASRPLMRGSGMKTTVAPEGQPLAEGDFLNTSINSVTPGYFQTLGIRMLAGRELRATDANVKPEPVVVNQAFARRFFPAVDPVGRRFGRGMTADFTIVGVTADAKYRSLREPMTPTFYSVTLDSGSVMHVRTRMDPRSIIEPVRRAVAALDPALPIVEIHTMEEEVDASVASERLTAMLAAVFGAVAALLAGAGIYGLLAYAVAQRRRDIGIRMALGAEPGAIGRMIGTQALGMVAIGAAAGIAGALVAGRWIQSLLYQVAPSDALSLGLGAAFVIAISLAASAIPARRAARVEPASTLRE